MRAGPGRGVLVFTGAARRLIAEVADGFAVMRLNDVIHLPFAEHLNFPFVVTLR